MTNSKATKDQIEEIREKAKRGRVKGYSHSEATKEKIGEGVSMSKEIKTEVESGCKQTEYSLTLEEALEKAVERYQYCRYVDHQAPASELFNVSAYYQRSDGSFRYYAIEQKIAGIRNTIPAAKRLLADANVSYITIRIVVYENGRWVKDDPAFVVVSKEGEEGKSYMVWYMDSEIRKEEES